MKSSTIVWFQQDLRLADNPALAEALGNGGAVLPLFIWAPEEEGDWAPGAASRWWLHHSLTSLDKDLRRAGSRLVIRRGGSASALRQAAQAVGANIVLMSRRYERQAAARNAAVAAELKEAGIECRQVNGSLLFDPEEMLKENGDPYQVFTPFWKACLARMRPFTTYPAPDRIPFPDLPIDSPNVESLKLLPTIDWAGGLRDSWQPGESGAAARLQRFLDRGIAGYAADRNSPSTDGSSRLSPHLHFGEIGPRTVWLRAQNAIKKNGSVPFADAAQSYLREVAWREFAYHLLFHFPNTPVQPLRPEFAAFPWTADRKALKAWQRGRTGYPLVDAGMRELWATGWMHNRVRMVTASFLVKDLLIPWQEGARWFWDTLVDADLANNTMGWQWTAGCGADAAPYFRIFNPVKQGEKFDPDGAYVRRWLPEIAELPNEWIHRPWEAPALALGMAGVELGRSYPYPIVDHFFARDRALAALSTLKTH